MPGTRYSATFDRTYVEESPPLRSPVRFSIQSWQGATLPGNPPLNGSYKNHVRTASTDSLDSSGTGASSSSSSASGTGHSRQVSMEGTNDSSSTRNVIKTPSTTNNPLKFVKVGPVPLYKKVNPAVEQIKLTKEVKVAKETIKEDEQHWQNNLDSWKNRRKKLSERTIQRVEDLKLLEEDHQPKQRNPRTKTFSEIMEDRASKPRAYNLSIYVENENDSPDTGSNGSSECGKSEQSPTFPDHNEDSTDQLSYLASTITVNNNKNQDVNLSNQDHVSTIEVSYDCPLYSNNQNANGTLREEQSVNSKESSVSCVEEDCNGCGVYTVDSGLESFSSSQRVGDIQDTSSELSVDSSGGYDRGVNEDEADGPLAEQLAGENDLLKDVGLLEESQSWLQNLDLKDGHILLNLRLCLNSEAKVKDFGFGIQEEKNRFLVENLKVNSIGWQAGLRPNDQILVVNGENVAGRSKKSILFVMKQSIFNGQLNLTVSRNETEDMKEPEKEQNEAVIVAEQVQPSSVSPRNAVSAIKRRLQNGHSFDDTWKDKNAHNDAFRSRSKSESSRTLEEKPDDTVVKKAPPPIPAKPKAVVVNETQTVGESISVSHAPIVRTISNEMKLERLCSNNVLKYMSEDGITDITQELLDAEEELDQELLVYEDSGPSGVASAEMVFCVEENIVETLSERRESPVVEGELVRAQVDQNQSFIPVHDLFDEAVHQASEENLIEAVDCESSITRQDVASLHLVKEDNGLNIIFESHPSTCEETEKELCNGEMTPVLEDSVPSLQPELESVVNLVPVQEAQIVPQEPEAIFPQPQDIEQVLQFLVNDNESVPKQESSHLECQDDAELDFHDDSQESEWVREELSAFCLDESSVSLDSLMLSQSTPDHLLLDLDSQDAVMMEPPKEKPPPPPPADSPEQIPKMNTFKRVKKELWKRRSDFLGIDSAGDEIDIDVPPPPDLSEILKSERDLERQNRLWMEKERYLSSSNHERTSSTDSQTPDDEEIARKEREIIENLEREEKAKVVQDVDRDEQELVSAERQSTLPKTEEDERILRLQEERRRMEEERFLREEQRIKEEEDRLFKEREEALCKQEEPRLDSPPKQVSPQSPPLLANPPPPLVEIRRDSRPLILPKPNRLSQNLENGRSEPLGKESGILEKEALQVERERLRREQERLQKEKEEYRWHVEMQQRRARELKLPLDPRGIADKQTNEKVKTPTTLSGRDALIYASKRPQGLSDSSSDNGHSPEVNGSMHSPPLGQDTMVESGQNSQQMSRNSLHFLGAAPKARIIQSEQWISQQDPVSSSKRRSEPVMIRDRGYNQNHWLVQEAEMRRISELNERQQQLPPEQRPHSISGPLRSQSLQNNGVSQSTSQLSRHISSTAPRPYQRPAPPPPPPPKPPHGMPAQPENPWNYRQVASVGMASRNGKEKQFLGDLRQYRSESVLGVPAPWNGSAADTQPEHLLSVSGKERCSHCAEPLGRGGAMIIESLQLYYHMACFCCCVCQAQLGNGTCGTDVRVRNHKLHCQNCYSNDEAGLKFSQV